MHHRLAPKIQGGGLILYCLPAVCVLLAVSFLASVGREIQAGSLFESSASAVKSASPLETFLSTRNAASLDPATLASLKSVFAARDFFEWYPIYKAEKENPSPDKIVHEAILAREAGLETESLPWTISESLELLAFQWKAEEKRPDGRMNYRISWLFRTSGKVRLEASQSLRLVMQAWVQPQHRHLLNEQVERDRGLFELTYTLEPPPEQWESGGYFLVSRRYPAAPVPFNLDTFFVLKENDKYKRPWGERVSLGWQIDLGSS